MAQISFLFELDRLLYCVAISFMLNTIVLSSSLKKSAPESTVSDGPATLYISQHCRTVFFNLIIDHDYVFLDDQAYLMAHPLQSMINQPAFVKQDVCVATFAAPPGHQLLLHFIDVAIDYRPNYKSRLYIFDGFNAEVHISPYNGLYGETKNTADTFTNVVTRDYVSGYQALTLMFSGYLSKRFYGFKAVLNPIKRTLPNNTCPDGLHLCVVSRYCIDRSLVCNGVSNCGERDGSDEGSQCQVMVDDLVGHYAATNMDDLGLMIGCGISILVLFLAVIWVAVLITKRQRLRRERHRLHAATAHSSPISDDFPQPPASDSSMWFPSRLPRGLYEWIYPDSPPPAYSERHPMDYGCAGHQVAEHDGHQPQDYEAPPPYTREQQESQALIQQNHTANQNIIINPLSVHQQQGPPDYNDINDNDVNANHQRSLLLASNDTMLENSDCSEPKDEEVDKNKETEGNKPVENECQSNPTHVESGDALDQDNVAESIQS